MTVRMGKLDGKIAVVTGTSRGVGVGIATELLREGATVVGCSRSPLDALPGAEAIDGGPIGLVADGDRIVVDVPTRSIELLVDSTELDRRRSQWKCPESRYPTGVLAKYARLVTGAERGAVTEP